MELFIKIELQIGTNTPVLVVPEKWEGTEFEFTLPVLVDYTTTGLSVKMIISAINVHDNLKSLTNTFTVNNTIASDFRSELFAQTYDYADLESIALLSAQMELLLTEPTNGLYSEQL